MSEIGIAAHREALVVDDRLFAYTQTITKAGFKSLFQQVAAASPPDTDRAFATLARSQLTMAVKKTGSWTIRPSSCGPLSLTLSTTKRNRWSWRELDLGNPFEPSAYVAKRVTLNGKKIDRTEIYDLFLTSGAGAECEMYHLPETVFKPALISRAVNQLMRSRLILMPKEAATLLKGSAVPMPVQPQAAVVAGVKLKKPAPLPVFDPEAYANYLNFMRELGVTLKPVILPGPERGKTARKNSLPQSKRPLAERTYPLYDIRRDYNVTLADGSGQMKELLAANFSMVSIEALKDDSDLRNAYHLYQEAAAFAASGKFPCLAQVSTDKFRLVPVNNTVSLQVRNLLLEGSREATPVITTTGQLFACPAFKSAFGVTAVRSFLLHQLLLQLKAGLLPDIFAAFGATVLTGTDRYPVRLTNLDVGDSDEYDPFFNELGKRGSGVGKASVAKLSLKTPLAAAVINLAERLEGFGFYLALPVAFTTPFLSVLDHSYKGLDVEYYREALEYAGISKKDFLSVITAITAVTASPGFILAHTVNDRFGGCEPTVLRTLLGLVAMLRDEPAVVLRKAVKVVQKKPAR